MDHFGGGQEKFAPLPTIPDKVEKTRRYARRRNRSARRADKLRVVSARAGMTSETGKAYYNPNRAIIAGA